MAAVPAPATEATTPPAEAVSSLPDEVQSAYDYMPATLAGYIAGIGVILLLYWTITPPQVLLPWLGLFAAVLLARAFTARRFRRATITTPADWQTWRRWGNAGTVICGALWGAAAWLFYPQGDSIQQVGLILLIYTYCVAGLPVLSLQPRLYFTFAVLGFAPMIARIAGEGTVYSYQLAGLLLLIISLTAVLARTWRNTLQRAIELKLHADELLAQLRVEKQAADAARREAEVANRAKTQFFTAASHDLRQPLHAMGLFAEALRNKSHDDEVAQLVNSINASVDALEGLFSELLDITRIDSGGVDVNPQHFNVGDIFRKLKLHFEPTAFEKGLALRLRGGKHMAFADPLLVERILRNLVSNAIRYTQDGSVLVSCRRRGDRLQLQVWDTGQGIGEAEQVRVFEEFYQVAGASSTDPHQRKGLGLGLAIVKRLADLMGAPLAMRSQSGRGTVFTLELPPGKAVPAAVASIPGKGPLGITLAGRLIVVVEDEPAVRSGLEALLRGWGATISSFDSVASATAWAQASDPSLVKPDLLIVDYRLEQGYSGVDAIAALRARFGPSVPAIMVTGSTMTGHDKEALDHDFHLLIKPVVPNKLRAMIAFKLGVKPGA
ncbi:ATP-binding protein [Piscinibacter sp.]|uniref:ATP-binding protein n=1 Tax=Piscinibacter sp. TaxID=1903157 RepID=UPI002C520D32|nr:ATP-binding protein [Albitalea sp.]HUG21267.1 ATP-binding protein [Albitalea sp.]